jgi:Ca2+-binding RTX toxin-like protein
MLGRVSVAVAALLISGFAASGAHAATLGFDIGPYSSTIVYTAARGEANDLVVSYDQSLQGVSGWPSVTFYDPGHRIKPDTSYDSASASRTLTSCAFLGDRASCQDMSSLWSIRLRDAADHLRFDPPQYWQVTHQISVEGGDGNDTLAGGWADSPVRIAGGPGDDTLLSGGLGELTGGPGANVMAPLPGSAYTRGSVSYYSDDTPQTGITVTLDGVANDGAPGEHDNVAPDIGTVGGTLGDDKLVGNGAQGGHDLYGGDGNDVLEANGGYGILSGATGDDTVLAADGVHQWISCSSGFDQVFADATDLLENDGDCELIDRS